MYYWTPVYFYCIHVLNKEYFDPNKNNRTKYQKKPQAKNCNQCDILTAGWSE